MYSPNDLAQIDRMLKKRRILAIVPACLIVAAAIIVFVYGQLQRSDHLWKLTTALTILGVGYGLFFYGVGVRPVRIYRKHVQIMLEGRKRETTGVFKSFADAVSDRDGVQCHAVMLNVGAADDPEDDRLFYYDAQLPRPDVPLGAMVKILSNDKMIADFQTL